MKSNQRATIEALLERQAAAVASAPMNDAYEAAKAGGKHAGWYADRTQDGSVQLEKAVRSIEFQIAQHGKWLENPGLKVQDWTERSGRYQDGLLSKWQKDIDRQREQTAILRGILKNRGK